MCTLPLPDTLKDWPWPRRINPHYREVKTASESWAWSFGVFDSKAQQAFDKCDFSLFASLTYPNADKELLRTACDLLHWTFMFDELSDVQDETAVRCMADAIIDGLRNPNKPCPFGEHIMGEVARQFWDRASKGATPVAQRRFLDSIEPLVNTIVEQARDRDERHLRTNDSYFVQRRDNIGMRPALTLLEFNNALPDEIFNHPSIVDLTLLATDIFILTNDLYSYNKEQARGDDQHNVIAIVMNELDMDLGEALKWLESRYKQTTNSFLEMRMSIPSWGTEMDELVQTYIDGMAIWVRGNDSCSFESCRYFGNDGPTVQKSRVVTPLPKIQVM